MKFIITSLLLFISFICYSQSITGENVTILDLKKRCTISASAIPAKTNISWTTNTPVKGTWKIVYENKEYILSLDNAIIYRSTQISGVKDHYSAALLRFVN